MSQREKSNLVTHWFTILPYIGVTRYVRTKSRNFSKGAWPNAPPPKYVIGTGTPPVRCTLRSGSRVYDLLHRSDTLALHGDVACTLNGREDGSLCYFKVHVKRMMPVRDFETEPLLVIHVAWNLFSEQGSDHI